MQARKRGDEGAAAVEFALVMPILFLLVFGIIDFGRAYQAKVELTHAAREGVRVWALTQDSAAATTATQNAAPTVGSQVSVSTTGCTFGTPTTLTATYEFLFLTPLPGLIGLGGGSPKTLSATGVMRCGG